MDQQIFLRQKSKRKIFGPKLCGSKEFFFQKRCWSTKIKTPKIGAQNFCQNWVSNSWDYSDMDKCCQEIHFINKCHPYSWNLLKMVPGTYLLTFETFLIWTIGARTNVAWTNVPLKVGICSRCSQEPTFKILSESGQ